MTTVEHSIKVPGVRLRGQCRVSALNDDGVATCDEEPTHGVFTEAGHWQVCLPHTGPMVAVALGRGFQRIVVEQLRQ